MKGKPTRKIIESAIHRGKEDTKRTNYYELPAKILQELAATQKLLEKLEPNKIRKMVRDIRGINSAFNDYMNEIRLNTIRCDDIYRFEEKYLKEQNSENSEKKGRKRSLEGVRLGFQMLRKKLQEYEFSDFINEINYYTSTFEREAGKLDCLGYEYKGLHLVRVPLSIIPDLQQEELENGMYTKIDRNLINKTAMIEAAEQQFKKAVKQE